MTMASDINVLPTLVQRLSESDSLLQLNSLTLINALFKFALSSKNGGDEFVRELNRLNVRKHVITMMQTSSNEELAKVLVDFQRHFILDMHQKKKTPVELESNPRQQKLLDAVLAMMAGSERDERCACSAFRCMTLSLFPFLSFPRAVTDTSDLQRPIAAEMERVGQLGLEMVAEFALNNKEAFFRVLLRYDAR